MSSMLKMVCSAPYQTFARTFGHFQGKKFILLVIFKDFHSKLEAFKDSFYSQSSSYPQTDEPNYFPELEVLKLAYKSG